MAKFTVRFVSALELEDRPYLVHFDPLRNPVGLRHIQKARIQFCDNSISVSDFWDSVDGLYQRELVIEISEDQAVKSGLFVESNQVSIDVLADHGAFNKYFVLYVAEASFCNRFKLKYEYNGTQIFWDWCNAGFPVLWDLVGPTESESESDSEETEDDSEDQVIWSESKGFH